MGEKSIVEETKRGRIIKGIAGFYYVHVPHEGVYECKAKGSFRKDGKKPLVGDEVELKCLDVEKMLGNITALLPRKSELIRPSVANIDQALIVFAIMKPTPNFNLLDRFLIMMQSQGLCCTICFNKSDIADEKEIAEIRQAYEACGNQVLFVSAKEETGLEEIRAVIANKTTAVAGPSGVGKSSLINKLCGCEMMQTGEISQKIERGRHTTRHTELFAAEQIGESTYLMDTPGFSSLMVFSEEKEALCRFYPEFEKYEANCKFQGCSHISEPVCGVKEAYKEGKISALRYENYKLLYEELKAQRKY